ncbi:recombinase family protein, partial [Faecalibacterium wellingii]|uniref:recombinase family protein n=1 Tax=Faecalibacterium wellingii TaxID=2929491 RepID=UPI003ED896E0
MFRKGAKSLSPCALSISNQKRILETYAKQNGFSNLRWYTDDGYSGANFQRPGFQAM